MSEEALDRFTIHAQLEHLFLKFPGTGTADTTKEQWLTEVRKDVLASNISHKNRLAYIACCENRSIGRVRHDMLEAMASLSSGGPGYQGVYQKRSVSSYDEPSEKKRRQI